MPEYLLAVVISGGDGGNDEVALAILSAGDEGWGGGGIFGTSGAKLSGLGYRCSNRGYRLSH